MSDGTPVESARLDDLRVRQQSAWRRGERLLVESLIAGGSPPLVDSELQELIYAEVLLRAERGELLQVDEYLVRFPSFAESLRRLFSRPEALEAPGGSQPERSRPPAAAQSGARAAADRSARGADRNLLFGILALQLDLIGRDGLVDALRDWTTQKDKPLGQILVERGDLSAARRELLEPLVDEHVRRHDDDPAASLASVSSLDQGTVDWHRVHDVDVAESLAVRRLTRNIKQSNEKSGSAAEGTKTSADRYRVLRPHARGGIGEVFLAYDEELHREVALKEIQSRHLKDDSHRERFVREAEVTGGLEHPGIVPVYSLGHHGDGRPFYAMRFIRGDSLKEAIERFHAERGRGSPPEIAKAVQTPASPGDVNTPTVIGAAPPEPPAPSPAPVNVERLVTRQEFESVEFRKLLGRFIDVCQAIEYAHSRGVLHRDLKPGNIMLGKYGETLVVDWGLAKLAGKEDRFAATDEATLQPSSGSGIEHTAAGSVIGTPAYMSPEQAAGRLEQLGPATDVYSLGATLYHVLTGRSPFVRRPLRELLEYVKRGEFPRPQEINPQVPQALSAVCLKAMSLRPEDRYTSSAAIAEDLEHWLADEPVNAHREGVLARGSRWVRKHRAWALSGAVALALVAVVSSVAAFRINSARKTVVAAKQSEANQFQLALRSEKLARENADKASREEKRADAEAIRAKVSDELTSFMRELFTSSDPTGLTGAGLMPAGEGSRNITAVELLGRGGKLMRDKFQNPAPADQLTRAAMVSVIGDVSRSLGLSEQAKPLLQEALLIRQKLLPPDDREIARSKFQLATWHTERGDFQEAEVLYAELLDWHRRQGTMHGVEAAEVQLRMSVLFLSIGDPRSEQLARAGLATREKLLGGTHRETAIGQIVLAASLMDQLKTVEAVLLGKSAVQSLMFNHGLNKEKSLTAVLEYQAALALARSKLLTLAIPRFRHAIDLMKQTLGPKHMYISMFLYELGSALQKNDQRPEAEEVFRECLDIVRSTVGLEHPRAVNLLSTYGDLLADLGRPEEGLSLINEALAASEKRYGKRIPWRFELACLGAMMAVKAKKFERASALGEEVLTILAGRKQPLNKNESISLANMAHLLGELPDITLCRKAYGKVFAMNERQTDLEHLWTDNLNYGGILAQHKFYQESEPFLREAVRLAKRPEIRRIRDFGPMSFTLLCLGKADWAAGRFSDAEANFRAALVEGKKDRTKESTRDAYSRLINFLITRQQFADATALVDQYVRRTDLTEISRTRGWLLQVVLAGLADNSEAAKGALSKLEQALGESAVPDAAMYRARAVLMAGGDVARELQRLDALPKNDEFSEGLLLVRTACALKLDKLESALEMLDQIQTPLVTDSKSQLRMLYKPLALFRKGKTDDQRKDLVAAVERADAYLASAKELRTPDIGGYTITNLVELRWWCRQIRQELKTDGK